MGAKTWQEYKSAATETSRRYATNFRTFFDKAKTTVKKHPRQTMFYTALTATSYVAPAALSALIVTGGCEMYYIGSPRKTVLQNRLYKAGITAFWAGAAFYALGIHADWSRRNDAIKHLRPEARASLRASNHIHMGDSTHVEKNCSGLSYIKWNDPCNVSVDAQVIEYQEDPTNGQFFRIKFTDSEGGIETHRYSILRPPSPPSPWPAGYVPRNTTSLPAQTP